MQSRHNAENFKKSAGPMKTALVRKVANATSRLPAVEAATLFRAVPVYPSAFPAQNT
jgi:hypothetical protein